VNLFLAQNRVRDSSEKPTERRHDERGLAADSPTLGERPNEFRNQNLEFIKLENRKKRKESRN
jgi:hypothetical protein